MKGLELCRAYFDEYGMPMLKREFSHLLDRVAVGLVGHGSECFGFDDEISRDHDFEARFSIWLTDEDASLFGCDLDLAYQKLPREFRGVRLRAESLANGDRRCVSSISSFYRYYTGCDGVPQSLEAWAKIPSFYLAEAVNGEVFYDGLGRFSEIRRQLSEDMPTDALKKRLASELFTMAQAGQYNLSRCMAHGEQAAAALALFRFAESALQVIYLLNGRYAPYYKWSFRGLDGLQKLRYEGELLKALVKKGIDRDIPRTVEAICQGVIRILMQEKYSAYRGDYLEPYAYAIHDTITAESLKALPIIL